MSTSSLDLLTELAQKARDVAARTLAQQRQALKQTQQQLQTLQQYHREYRQSLQQKLFKDGMSPASLANYRAFLASLDRAMDRASQSLEKHQQDIAGSQLEWQVHWRRQHALQTLGQRRLEQALQQAGRREQRLNDELGARMRQFPGAFAATSDPHL